MSLPCQLSKKMLTHETELSVLLRASFFCPNSAYCTMSKQSLVKRPWLWETKIYVWQFRICVREGRVSWLSSIVDSPPYLTSHAWRRGAKDILSFFQCFVFIFCNNSHVKLTCHGGRAETLCQKVYFWSKKVNNVRLSLSGCIS